MAVEAAFQFPVLENDLNTKHLVHRSPLILILATQRHPEQSSLRAEVLCQGACALTRDDAKGANILRSLLYFTIVQQQSSFLSRWIWNCLCVLLVRNKKGDEEKACTFGDLESY